MRPIRLTMNAFGPFGGVETIDFRDATDAGLFGIYGPTGSGKSTIFSAIAFALFGEGAKEEQGPASMRSHLATPELMTEVSLLFAIGTKRYLVRRIPDQTRLKTRGEGETTQAHTAWLFDVSDVAIDDVGLENCGKLIAERKVSEVNAHVQTLLGYGVTQFRQIVLLPQGRFERFLLSSSSDRLKILRELFDVSVYRRLADKLKEDAVAVRQEIADGYRLNNSRLQTEGFASSDELTDGIAQAAGQVESAKQRQAETSVALKAANDALAAGKARQKLFVEVSEAAYALQVQQQRQAQIDDLKTRKSAAEAARRMADLDAALTDARQRDRAAQTAHTQAVQAAANAKAQLEITEKTLSDLQAGQSEIESLSRNVDKMEQHKAVLAAAEGHRSALDEAERQLALATQTRESAVTERESAEQQHKQCTAALAEARDETTKREQLEKSRDTLASELKICQDYVETERLRDDAHREQLAAERRVSLAQTEHENARQAEAEAEATFIAAQAGFLAERLENGQPCAVCGSTDHPEPAQGADDAKLLEQAWQQAKRNRESAAATESQVRASFSSAKSTCDERNAALDKLTRPTRPFEDIRAEHQAVVVAIDACGDPVDLDAMAKLVDDFAAAIPPAETKLQEAGQTYATQSTAEAVARRVYEDCIAAIPDDLRDPVILDERITDAKNEVTRRNQAIAAASERQREALAAKSKADADQQNAAVSSTEWQMTLASKQAEFTQRLSELGIAQADYQAARPDIAQIEDMNAAIVQFDKDLTAAQTRHDLATKAIDGLADPDLTPLSQACELAQRDHDDASTQNAAAANRLQSLHTLQTSLADQLERLRQREEATGPIRELADQFAGNNPIKTPLETYAIGAMFDQVLEAANLRLAPMTAGRYRFERDTESVGGRSKRGLEVRVHDIQTGRPREVITLSGGETFIAALSLALGLSDIVEMSRGAISLDTIFIDEGFGSLDTENDAGTLDLVLNVLQNIVSERRAVGLISHVQLVQHAVPNGFTVLKGPSGSAVEVRKN